MMTTRDLAGDTVLATLAGVVFFRSQRLSVGTAAGLAVGETVNLMAAPCTLNLLSVSIGINRGWLVSK